MTNRARKSHASNAGASRQAEISEDMNARLTEGIARLADTDEWQRYLKVQATFPRYSFGNAMAILCQLPGATLVMPYGDRKSPKPGTWLAVGRYARSGETALRIRKPWFQKVAAADSPDGKDHFYRKFIWVPVFDVSQTDGDPLPEGGVSLLQGADDQDVLGQVAEFIASRGYRAEFVPNIPGSTANGDCSPAGVIRVCTDGRSARQQSKTGLHEAAHMLLHMDGTGALLPRGRKELEAESVAYVVLQHLGIDSDDYSFGYVLGWAGGTADQARKSIEESGKRIHEAAAEILRHLGADIPVYDDQPQAREPEAVAA